MIRTPDKSSQSFRNSRAFSILLIVFSAVLLIGAYPKTDFWFLAWFALVPLFSVLDGKDARASFGYGYLLGILFFWGTLYWFVHVTIIGAMGLLAYLALYFGFFGLGCRFFSSLNLYQKMLVLPSLWVGCEYLRGYLFTGFGWVNLGHSQYKNLAFIQIAEWTGVYGVSFLVLLVNLVIWEVLFKRGWKAGVKQREAVFASMMTLIVLGATVLYGWNALSKEEALKKRFKATNDVKVAVIQGNIPQEDKWKETSWPWIMEDYLGLTDEVLHREPDLIIWPETSFPGFLWEDIEYFVRVRNYVEDKGIPLLFGSITHEEEIYYNSAILLSADGGVQDKYDKLHLVPFGEFLPLRGIIPYLAEFVPIEDFTPGRNWTLFADPEAKLMPFATLICFEDTVASLARQFVLRGGRLLVNITNDAWFEDSKAPYLHLQSSVFRSVENRRYLIRAANTGVSAVIDPAGRIINTLKGKNNKETYVPGSLFHVAQFREKLSPYTKIGDLFAFLGFFCILGGVAIILIKNNKNRH